MEEPFRICYRYAGHHCLPYPQVDEELDYRLIKRALGVHSEVALRSGLRTSGTTTLGSGIGRTGTKLGIQRRWLDAYEVRVHQ